MPRFYGTMKKGRFARHVSTRCGDCCSGLIVTCRGWDSGVTVEADTDGDKDIFNVFQDGGSHNPDARIYLGSVVDGNWLKAEG